MRNETRATSPMRFLPLLCLASQLAFAGTWSGFLVDARCYQSAEDNHNVSDSPALKDGGLEIRLCSPKKKTHSFSLVAPDGAQLNLNATGNKLAADLVRQGPKKSQRWVTVTGQLQKNEIAVSSITPVK